MKRMKPHDYEFNYAIDGMVIKKSFRFCKISATMYGKDNHLMTQQQAVLLREADLPHQFRNGYDSDNMRIFLTYASAGVTRTMVETGETHLIDADYKA